MSEIRTYAPNAHLERAENITEPKELIRMAKSERHE